MYKPKTKANQLYHKFLPKVRNSNLYDTYHNKAKECALICVNEIQELLHKPMFEYKESTLWKAEYGYWEEVKYQIEMID